jgi:hypothetical protein
MPAWTSSSERESRRRGRDHRLPHAAGAASSSRAARWWRSRCVKQRAGRAGRVRPAPPGRQSPVQRVRRWRCDQRDPGAIGQHVTRTASFAGDVEVARRPTRARCRSIDRDTGAHLARAARVRRGRPGDRAGWTVIEAVAQGKLGPRGASTACCSGEFEPVHAAEACTKRATSPDPCSALPPGRRRAERATAPRAGASRRPGARRRLGCRSQLRAHRENRCWPKASGASQLRPVRALQQLHRQLRLPRHLHAATAEGLHRRGAVRGLRRVRAAVSQ